VVAPYFGPILDETVTDFTSHKTGNTYHLDIQDQSLLKGLFFQWVNTEYYQWNLFFYHAPDVNFSTLFGGHAIVDRYFRVSPIGKWVVGGGMEYLRIDMDADSNLMVIPHSSIRMFNDFEITNNVYVPFIRGGYRFQYKKGFVSLAAMPWIGLQYEGVRRHLFVYPTSSVSPPP